MTQRALRRQTPVVSLLLVLVLLTSSITSAQRRSTTSTEPGQRAKRPRLVLLIAVDQFRYDYLERFNDLFVGNGFKRLMRDGASWTQSNYDHIPTYTAPGHATMMTGAYPAESGIVGNEWPDRVTGRRVTSVSDTTVTLLGGGSKRRRFKSATFDELNCWR